MQGVVAHNIYFAAERAQIIENHQSTERAEAGAVISEGEAVVVDALRHVDRYLEVLASRDVRLVAAVDTHGHADHVSGGRALAEAYREGEVLERRLMHHVEETVLAPGEFEQTLDRIANREVDPYGAAASILKRLKLTPEAGSLDTATPGHIDHVGIAVQDATELIDLFQRYFGLSTGDSEDIGPHRVRFIETGDTTVELVEPREADSAIGKFLRSRGPGLHHICLRVPDIVRAMADLRAKGVRFVDEAPRSGAHGSRIAFIHPASVGGLLVELKQKADAGSKDPASGANATRRS